MVFRLEYFGLYFRCIFLIMRIHLSIVCLPKDTLPQIGIVNSTLHIRQKMQSLKNIKDEDIGFSSIPIILLSRAI